MTPFERDIDARGGHLSDARLMQVLDGEYPDAVTDAHLLHCPPCVHRLDRLRRRTERFAQLLAEYGMPQPASAARATGRSRLLVRWAAGVALVVGAASLASPRTRAAIAQVGDWIWDSGGQTPVAAAGRAEVRFRPVGDTVSIRFLRRQEEGRLTLDIASGELVSLTAASAEAGIVFLVEDGGVLVRNPVEARTDYQVTVPPTVSYLRIRTADEVQMVRITEGTGSPAVADVGRMPTAR